MGIFLLSCVALIVGYFLYGFFIEKVFKINPQKKTPAVLYADGVDYVPLPIHKIFLIQFLNIAGSGPVFGAILGALYGPICLLWIVLGTVFAGAVHDYLSGMLSLRYKGRSVSFLMEKFFGTGFKCFFLIFLVFFLILVGAVFAMSPAQMLANETSSSFLFWIFTIFGYYFLATLLPIDKIIGRFYPYFALLLLGVTISLIGVLFTRGTSFYPNLTILNQHPDGLPIFPLMFVTIACGALSGFHATQSPMMARCLTNEKYGRPVFYGAMITEGVIALMWATLGMSFYQGSQHLYDALQNGGPIFVVSDIAKDFLGSVGGFLTVLSVVILSVTSGDTAFRSARLNLADVLHLSQKIIRNRLLLSIAVLLGGIGLCFIPLMSIWSYFGWANQLLATLTLWTCTLYLRRRHSLYVLTLLPALFMTVVCITYITYERIGLNLPLETARVIGISVSFLFFWVFVQKKRLFFYKGILKFEDQIKKKGHV